jgi:hypothetical protein
MIVKSWKCTSYGENAYTWLERNFGPSGTRWAFKSWRIKNSDNKIIRGGILIEIFNEDDALFYLLSTNGKKVSNDELRTKGLIK